MPYPEEMRKLCLLFVSALTVLLVGCGPHWVVVRQATPNPMTPAARFFVDRVSLEGIMIGQKSEAEWMSAKSGDTQQSWEGDKAAMLEEFSHGFEDARDAVARVEAPADAFIIRAHFIHYEPGFYTYVVNSNAQIDAVVDILDAHGTPLDQFQIAASSGGIAAGSRARACAFELGRVTAKYVRARVGL